MKSELIDLLRTASIAAIVGGGIWCATHAASAEARTTKLSPQELNAQAEAALRTLAQLGREFELDTQLKPGVDGIRLVIACAPQNCTPPGNPDAKYPIVIHPHPPLDVESIQKSLMLLGAMNNMQISAADFHNVEVRIAAGR